MTAVWRLDMPSTDKLVLLALADSANDDGVCWTAVRAKTPGKLDLLTKCSLSERAIQGAIKRLCASGLLSRVERPGKGVIYTVTPAADAPPQQMRPAGNDVDPRSICGETVSNPKIESIKPARVDEGFAEFWALYPLKVARKAALKAYASALKETDHATIIAGLSDQRRWGAFKPGFTPHAATWLNRGSWADERDASGQVVAGSPNSRPGRSGTDDIASIVARRHAEDDARMAVPRGEAGLFGDDDDWRHGAIEGEYQPGDHSS